MSSLQCRLQKTSPPSSDIVYKIPLAVGQWSSWKNFLFFFCLIYSWTQCPRWSSENIPCLRYLNSFSLLQNCMYNLANKKQAIEYKLHSNLDLYLSLLAGTYYIHRLLWWHLLQKHVWSFCLAKSNYYWPFPILWQHVSICSEKKNSLCSDYGAWVIRQKRNIVNFTRPCS